MEGLYISKGPKERWFKVKVTVWNENIHEQTNQTVKEIYPKGIHGLLAQVIEDNGFNVKTATLEEPSHGLSDKLLEETDVLLWWGHVAHEQVEDSIVEKIHQRVLDGMGIIVLHSGHFSKIFKRLMGTSCELKWRDIGEKEYLWVVDPTHPIAEGIDEKIILSQEEMYGEHFDIPSPDEVIFVGWFEGGEIFRSGVTYQRGKGKIFYFQPGHETFPTFHQKDIQQVIINAIKWAQPDFGKEILYGYTNPLQNIGQTKENVDE